MAETLCRRFELLGADVKEGEAVLLDHMELASAVACSCCDRLVAVTLSGAMLTKVESRMEGPVSYFGDRGHAQYIGGMQSIVFEGIFSGPVHQIQKAGQLTKPKKKPAKFGPKPKKPKPSVPDTSPGLLRKKVRPGVLDTRPA